MTDAKLPETTVENSDDRAEWTTPQIVSHDAAHLTQAGGASATDGGGPGNDCS